MPESGPVPHPVPGCIRTAALCAGLVLAATSASAQLFKDAALQALHQADKPAELERVALQRLASQADDTQAVLALAVSALAGGEAKARQAAITHAEGCVQRRPQAVPCHYALGIVLGVQAMSEGMLKAARSAGTVRTALAQAHLLEPTWYPARSALVEFYLLAPGMMGGSTAKAGELAAGAPQPEQARALQARVALLQDGKTELALQALTALLTVPEPELAGDVREWGAQAAFSFINAGQAPKAQTFFERLSRDQPIRALGPYGLGRVRTEAGAFEEAVKLFDQAAALKGADSLPIDYRRGIALQQLGRADAAKVAFNRFLGAGKGQKPALEDARKRLDQLGS